MLSKVGQNGMGFSGSPASRIGALAMAAISPAFVTFLLFKVSQATIPYLFVSSAETPLQVSGIPMSEKKYDKRYGDRKDYQEWKKNTPVFFPKL